MNNTFWFFSLLMFSASLVAEPLRLLNWEDYIDPEVLQAWQEQEGQLEEIYFDNDQDRDAILMNSERHQIDIAVVDEVIASRFGRNGSLIKLDETLIPNLKHIEPFWRQRCGEYAIPYLWGTLGIAYRDDKVKTPPKSWADILLPEQSLQGHIGMINDFADLLGPALFYLNYDLNTGNQEELKDAFSLLKKQAQSVLTYEYPLSYMAHSPRAKELYMAVAYSGDQYSLTDRFPESGYNWSYAIPEEGTVLWVDCLAINRNSRKQKEAIRFLNYISSPEVAARNAIYNMIATPNLTAKSSIPKEQLQDLSIYPDQTILAKSQLYKEMSNKNTEIRLKISNAILNIHESKKTH